MTPKTAALLELIETERGNALLLANKVDADLAESRKVSEELERELMEPDPETTEALDTLRRVGLLRS